MKRLKTLLIGLVCLVLTLPIVFLNNVYAETRQEVLVKIGWGCSDATASFYTTHIATSHFDHCSGQGGSGCTFGYKYSAAYADTFDITDYEYVIVECSMATSITENLNTSVNLVVTDTSNSNNVLFTNTTVGSTQKSNPIFSRDVDSIKLAMTGSVIEQGHLRHTASGVVTATRITPTPSYIKITGYGNGSPKFNTNSYVQSNGNLTRPCAYIVFV